MYVVSLLSVLGGGAFALLLGRFLGSGRRAAAGEFTGQAQSLIGAVLLSSFILLTGFQVAGAWSALSTARAGTYDEARALGDAYFAAGLLAPADGTEVRRLLRAYTGAVRTAEFPALAHGRTSPAAWRDLDRVRTAVAAAPADGTARQDAKAAAQTALNTVYQARVNRAAQATARMPEPTWLAMLGTGGFLVAFPALLGLSSTARQLTALCFVGAAVAFAICFAGQLDRPFQEPFGVRPAAFALAGTRFDQMDAESGAAAAAAPPR